MSKKAIILLSGGLDSATVLYEAMDQGYDPHCLIFDYGQKHNKEIKLAQNLAEQVNAPFHVANISLPWQGSSLLDQNIDIPDRDTINPDEIPSTYVPARNIIFLSFAASYAEAVEAETIFIGANALDYSGYPDCRPSFFEAFQEALNQGQKSGVEGQKIKIKIPLLHLTKAEIISRGMKLGVPYDLTWSCYRGEETPCGRCDSCLLRQKGFEEAGYGQQS